MKRLHIFLTLSVLLLLTLFSFLFWLNVYYLPKKARPQLVKELEAQTGLKVELGALSYDLIHGINLKDLKCRSAQDQKLLFKARHIYIQCLFSPLFLEKKVIASSVTFDRPELALFRLPDGRWHLPVLAEKKTEALPSFPFTPKISVVDGSLFFVDQTLAPPVSKHLTRVSGKMALGLPFHFRFKASFGIEGSPLTLTAVGTSSPKGEHWSATLDIKQFSLSDIAPYAAQSASFLESGKGDLFLKISGDSKGGLNAKEILFLGETKIHTPFLKGETHCRIGGEFTVHPDAKVPDYALHLLIDKGTFETPFLKEPFQETKGELSLKNDELVVQSVSAFLAKNPVTLQGKLTSFQDPEADLTVRSPVEARTLLEALPSHPFPADAVEGTLILETRLTGKIAHLSVSGSAQAKDITLKGIPNFGTIEHLRGPMEFTEDSLKSAGLSGVYGTYPFELSGIVTDFKNPTMDLHLRFTQALKALEAHPFLKGIPEKFRPTLAGVGAWDLSVRGPVREPPLQTFEGNCELEKAFLKIPSLPSPVEKLDGKISFDPKTVSWKGVSGMVAGNPFVTDGLLQKGQTPELNVSLTTKNFQLQTSCLIQGKDLHSFTFSRRTPQSVLTLQGDILNDENPSVALRGRFEGGTEELKRLNFFGNTLLPAIPFQGDLATQFSLTGLLSRPSEMAVEGSLSSQELRFQKWVFKNLTTRYAYRQNAFTLSQWTGTLFQGELKGHLEMRLSEPKHYQIGIDLQRASLNETIQHFSQTSSPMRGVLSGVFRGEGDMSDIGTLIGDGWMKIEEGDLFQFPVLGGMTPTLRPVIGVFYPQLDTWVLFRGASGHFTVKEKTVTTEDLTLTGDKATLYGQGRVGFDQSVDFQVGIQFTDPEILQRPTEFSRLKNIFISDAGMLAGEVRVTGTLARPNYKYSALPLKRIQGLFRETRDILFEKLFE